MSEREDNRAVELLYGELSADEASEVREGLGAEERDELEGFESVLGVFRSVEDEDPPAHLDALILAKAREAAEAHAEQNLPWWRKMLRGPTLGLALAGTAAVFVAVISIPVLEAPQTEVESAPTATIELEESTPAKSPLAVVAAPAEAPAFGDESAKLEKSRDLRRAAEDALAESGEEQGYSSGKRSRKARRQTSRPERKAKADRGPTLDNKDVLADELAAAAPADDESGIASGRGGGSLAQQSRNAREEADRDGLAIGGAIASSDQPTARPAAKPVPPAGAEAEPAMEPPPPAPPKASAAPVQRSKAKSAKKEAPAPEPESRAQDKGGSEALSYARGIEAQARQMIAKKEIVPARKLLRESRAKVVSSPNAYARLSLVLAELELGEKNFQASQTYARDAMRTDDPQVKRRAQVVLMTATQGMR